MLHDLLHLLEALILLLICRIIFWPTPILSKHKKKMGKKKLQLYHQWIASSTSFQILFIHSYMLFGAIAFD